MIRLCSFVVLVSLAFLAATAPASAQQAWLEYRPPGAGFRVEFPGTPKLDSTDLQSRAGPIHLSYATYQNGPDSTFVSTHTVYAAMPATADPQTLLGGARNGAVKGINGKLREEKRLTVGGRPALLFTIDGPDGTRVAVVLAVANGNNLYQAIAGMPAGQENSADVKRFLDSLALTPR
jgi:hypothetical protein